MTDGLLDKLAQAIVDLDEAAARAAAEEAVKAEINVKEAIRALAKGMRIIGEKWQKCEVFMPEVLVAADAFYAGMDILLPKLAEKTDETMFSGIMVIGTIFGDVHTVGKDVAKAVFAAELNLRVIDLGIEVPSHKFVEAVKEHNADIVGIGTYMSETFFNAPKVIEALKKAGLRDKVIVICGGPAVDMRTAKKFGADGAWNDAWEAVPEIRRMLDELKKRVAT